MADGGSDAGLEIEIWTTKIDRYFGLIKVHFVWSARTVKKMSQFY